MNSLITGIMWGVVIHALINVVLPQLKTLNLSQLFNFNVQAQTTPPTTTPPTTTPPTGEEEEEPEEEEEEPIEEEEDYGENAEEYDEDSPEGQATSERVNEMYEDEEEETANYATRVRIA